MRITRDGAVARLVAAALICFVVFSGTAARAQGSYQPSKENLQARQWFQDAKFGMFVHWGIYSELGSGEWVMQEHRISAHDYEKLAAQFYPARFDAQQWVAAAKAAGMKYITVTTRHHDGFAMFDTKQSDWNIVQRTPYGKDVIRQLADECHKQGIKLFFYYSQLDWHHPDYFPLGDTGRSAGRPQSGEWNRYIDFMNGQLTELLTNYGEVGGIWFDGMWDKPDADWQLERTYQLIHRLQPQALIIPNHHKRPFPGEDVQTFERDLPGENKAGFSGASVSELPLETSDTLNHSWGFNLTDANGELLPFYVYMLATAGVNLATLIPQGPGYIGVFEAVAKAVLVGAFGVDENPALSYVLVLHAALLIPVTLLGFYYMARESMSYDDLVKLEETRAAAAVEAHELESPLSDIELVQEGAIGGEAEKLLEEAGERQQ
jgi:alpha-L-fucosidase